MSEGTFSHVAVHLLPPCVSVYAMFPYCHDVFMHVAVYWCMI